MNTDEHRLSGISERIIGCAYKVSNTLGSGFLEKVYENALAHELRRAGLAVIQQHGIAVLYDDVVVSEYVTDLLVEKQILVELKAAKTLDEIYMAQCMNYLRATRLRLCLLMNFGRPRIEIKRIIL